MSNNLTLLDAWLTYHQLHSVSKKSEELSEYLWRLYIHPYFQDIKLGSIKAITIMQFRRSLEVYDLSPQTIHHCLGHVRRVLNKAVKWELYPGPVPHFEMPKVNNRRVRFLSHGEAQKLLAELECRSQLWHDIVYLALSTGLRAGEIFGLKSEDFNPNTKTLSILNTKTHVSRVLPVTETVCKALKRHYSPEKAYIFLSNKGNKLCTPGKPFKQAIKACGFNKNNFDRRNKIVFHSLRHTFASWLVQKGTPIMVVSHLLGHSNLTMTLRYSHLAPDQGAKAMELITL